MRLHSRSRVAVFAAALWTLVGALPAAARAADAAPLGKVVALEGDAWVEHPGLAQRALACGDALSEGDVLVTGPGARAGIQAGDVVTAVNGAPVMRSSDFATTIAAIAPNTTADLSTSRDGHTIEVTLMVGSGKCPSEQHGLGSSVASA